MASVKVLTITEAAKRMAARRERVTLLLARQELTTATINGRPAVLDDLTFRQMQRKASKAVAA